MGGLHGAERTENAAVAPIRAQQGLTIAALIEKLTSVRGHPFVFRDSALRARQDGFKNNGIRNGVTLDRES